MSDFLLELRCEEIPARMQAGARAELEKLFRAQMSAAGVALGEVTVWSTPRRLALIAAGLPDTTEAVSEEFKGPRTSAPEQALDGFLRKTGLTRGQLEDRDGVWFAVVDKPGRAVSGVLAEAIPAIIRSFSWPKSMRWGAASLSTESLRWVRPLSGIVAILGEELVPCEVDGITSGYATHGHRFHAPGPITIGSAHDYQEKLRACHVIVDHAERQDTIRKAAAEVASAAGLTLVEDEGLVVENAGLTEWPVPLLGRFDEAFLAVPPEVIQLTARVNQKYFVCTSADGKLANAFVCTANITADDPAVVVDGNRKVLAARLSDARFFWEQDQKVSLADHAKKLARITFHEKLGNLSDRCERFGKLLGQMLSQNQENREKSISSSIAVAKLAKADLVTEMVGEFPELQGVMGGYYFSAEGGPETIAAAIRTHYSPVGPSDLVPIGDMAYMLALADKLELICSFFAISEAPTGSKDPFALRRSALGVCRIVLERKVRLNLRTWITLAVNSLVLQAMDRLIGYYENDLSGVVGAQDELRLDPDKNSIQFRGLEVAVPKELRPWLAIGARFKLGETQDLVVEQIFAFIVDRLKVQQREAGVRHDLIDAVFALGGEDDLVRLLARVHALQAFIATPDGTNLLAGYKRAANILKKEQWTPGAANPAPEPAEAALIAALAAAEPQASAAIAAEDFAGAMAALATLRAPIDAFFESVTVNDADPAKRAARLDLLARFRGAVHNVADFSRIEG